MTDFAKYVNVFHGCAEIDLPKPEGVAATWYFIKGLSGNTSPAASLPFGKMSCGCYSGGYPTGYGRQEVNTDTYVKKLTDKLMTLGVSHMHQHGTGAIVSYYNYAVTAPFFGGLENIKVPRTIESEDARPGYYGLTTVEDNISFEVTVSEKCAVHQYHFGKEGGRIAIDFANNGLYENPYLRRPAYNGKITLISKNEAAAEVELEGVRVYFHVVCENSSAVSLYNGTDMIEGNTYSFDVSNGQIIGCVFEADAEDVRVKVSLTGKNAETAREFVYAETRELDVIAGEAYAKWNEYLSAIEIEADERTKGIFYSNLYHSLTKPADWAGESHIYDEEDYMIDFATLWDIYKTQLPLVFSLYPDITKKIVNTYTNVCSKVGIFPNSLLLYTDYAFTSEQSSMLGEYLICDAYYRGAKGIDWMHTLDCVKHDMSRESYRDFIEKGCCDKSTHTIDMAEAAGNTADVARELGREDIAEYLDQFKNNWLNAYDKETGLLIKESPYYEGTLWNYSFRPMRDMEARIALCGSSEKFVEYLDKVFGFTDPDDRSARFEGFNNESDMEAPYAYVYAGRQDRLCDIINGASKYMFVEGRGGIPGNNDSGGLSSCYIWNTIGVFPVSGQDLMLVGCPQLPKAVMHLANGKDFTVIRKGQGDYVDTAVLNGKVLHDFRFTVREMMNGGVLEITMKESY